MNMQFRALSALAVSSLAFALVGATSVPNLPLPSNAAMIFNPGSGDFAGFRIVVEPSGSAVAVDGAGRASSELQPDVVQKFFNDLAAAGPLSALSSGSCGSATPDTQTTTVEVNSAVVVTWRGQRSPALTCVSDPRAVKILLDATEIQHALYVQAYRKRTMIAYGSSYPAGTYRPSGFSYYSGSGFYIDRFSVDRFDAGLTRSNGPYGSVPTSSQVFTSLLSGSPFTSLPAGSLPLANPFTSSPYSSLPTVIPYSSGPYAASPFVSAPYSSTGTSR